MTKLTEDDIRKQLKTVTDPALAKDLVTMRQVKRIAVDGDAVTVGIELITPAYPKAMRDELRERVTRALRDAGAGEVRVEFTSAVAARPAPADKARLPGVKNIIAVAAGKGGVGKSTVATNLALALRKHGATVGLLDADVFGPSVPQMLGPPQIPATTTAGQKIVPAVHYDIKVISIGFFVEKDKAVVWRGPMVHRLLQQFLEDVDWGELDYLVCDLPPGTGDVQLSLSQLIPITGAVMVTTPQEVALIDVVKGIQMFENVAIPILGIVENMSYYVCPACGHHDDIFSRGGGKRLAAERGIEFLGELPIDAKVRFGGDSGVPVIVAAPESEHAQRFMDIASKVAVAAAARVLAEGRRSPGLTVIR
ncbi:MAG: iron-sulfur cluster carrier protein ApbC [Deltaproteobacteria bacterium]|nr:MAG: iron-sulfur cluster carrier protein ApbC [Deltaproteobacteria bacterium]